MHFFFSEDDIDEGMLHQIIRPGRQSYNVSDLGAPVKLVEGIKVQRKDFIVKNEKQESLYCSLHTPANNANSSKLMIYLHGNAGSRLEVTPMVQNFIPMNISVLGFDFSGCGMSEGKYITLGCKEVDDLHAVMKHIYKQFPQFTQIGLIGRSMGAVVALMYTGQPQKYPQQYLTSIILDSPFSSFKKLAEQIGEKKFGKGIASFFISGGIKLLRKRILTETGHDVFSLKVHQFVQNCRQSALFLYSPQDTLVNSSHSQILFENYAGSKDKFAFQGEHNAYRDQFYYKKVKEFLTQEFQQQQQQQQQQNRSSQKQHQQQQQFISLTPRVQNRQNEKNRNMTTQPNQQEEFFLLPPQFMKTQQENIPKTIMHSNNLKASAIRSTSQSYPSQKVLHQLQQQQYQQQDKRNVLQQMKTFQNTQQHDVLQVKNSAIQAPKNVSKSPLNTKEQQQISNNSQNKICKGISILGLQRETQFLQQNNNNILAQSALHFEQLPAHSQQLRQSVIFPNKPHISQQPQQQIQQKQLQQLPLTPKKIIQQPHIQNSHLKQSYIIHQNQQQQQSSQFLKTQNMYPSHLSHQQTGTIIRRPVSHYIPQQKSPLQTTLQPGNIRHMIV